MRVFRIEREKYLNQTLTGVGAAKVDGFRWNSLNTSLVYTAGYRSLAMLEVCVHLDLSEDMPSDRYFVEIDIPDDIEILRLMPDSLPENWDARPPTLATQYIGDDFVTQQSAAVLQVPSCMIPEEYNYLINPAHTDVKRIKVVSTTRVSFDSRMRGI